MDIKDMSDPLINFTFSSDASVTSDATSNYFTPMQSPANSYSQVDSTTFPMELNCQFESSNESNTVSESQRTFLPNYNNNNFSMIAEQGDSTSLASTPSTIRGSNVGFNQVSSSRQRHRENWLKTQQGMEHNIHIQRPVSSAASSVKSETVQQLIFKVEDLQEYFNRMNDMKQVMEEKFTDIYSLIGRLSVEDEQSQSVSTPQDIVDQPPVDPVKPASSRPGSTVFDSQLTPVKDKFESLPAFVKGYLTRRLAKTEKVFAMLETIRDIVVQLIDFDVDNMTEVTDADVEFHERLMKSLQNAIDRYYAVFFHTSVKEQMEMIRLDREKKIREDIMKRMERKTKSYGDSKWVCSSPIKRPTSATIKRQERLRKEGLLRSQSCMSSLTLKRKRI